MYLEEIEECINKYKISNFYFSADSFTFDRDWVIKFCNIITNKKLKINWLCNTRADCIDEDMVTNMKKAGCWGMSIGVESGSQSILNKIGKGIKLETIAETFNMLNKNKIVTLAHFMIGFPWDNYETVNETIKYALKLKCTLIDFNIVIPFHGTALRKIFEQYNLLSIDCPLERTDYRIPTAKTLYLSSDELIKLRKKALFKVYFRPVFIVKALSLVKSFKQFYTCFGFMFYKFIWLFKKQKNYIKQIDS